MKKAGNRSTRIKPRPRASENANYKSRKVQASTETRTRTLVLVAGACWEVDGLNVTRRVAQHFRRLDVIGSALDWSA